MNFVSKFMDADHAYLDELWDNFLSKRKQPNKASESLKVFKEHLFLHFKLEDQYLFPRLNDYMKMENATSGLTRFVLRDHRNILKLLGFVEEQINSKDSKRLIEAVENLDVLLKKHRQREEDLQYPVSDIFIKKEEWDTMLYKIYGESLASNKQTELLL